MLKASILTKMTLSVVQLLSKDVKLPKDEQQQWSDRLSLKIDCESMDHVQGGGK